MAVGSSITTCSAPLRGSCAVLTAPVPLVPSPTFAPDATGAVWDGRSLLVWFREGNLPPGTTTTVSVLGVGAVDVTADHDLAGQRRRCTEVVVSWQAACQVGDDGTASGGVILPLVAGGDDGWPGRDRSVTARRTFSAVVRDLDTGATAYLAGPATRHR